MNKKLFLLVAFVLSLSLGFTACGDDDKDEPSTDYAAQVAGTYNGLLNVDLGATEESEKPDPINQDIKIERLSENKIKLSVTDFVFPGIGDGKPIGNIEVETTVSENNGSIIIADKSDENVALLKDEDGNPSLTAKAKLYSASVKNGKLTLKIDVTDISISEITLPYTVEVEFTGNKK